MLLVLFAEIFVGRYMQCCPHPYHQRTTLAGPTISAALIVRIESIVAFTTGTSVMACLTALMDQTNTSVVRYASYRISILHVLHHN